MLVAGLLLTATIPILGRGFANAVAPLIGALLFVVAASRYQPSKRRPRVGSRAKVALIVACCAFMVVLILIAVPSGR